jgi:hypothetical protein
MSITDGNSKHDIGKMKMTAKFRTSIRYQECGKIPTTEKGRFFSTKPLVLKLSIDVISALKNIEERSGCLMH